MELNFKNTKVLLVDDDENYGFALKTLLGSKGLEINSFTNPEEALNYLKSNDTDIILLDYYMPQMTGEEFLKKFREFNKETIVFLQTAFSEEKPELEMLETLNIQGYIDKNKDPNEIFLEISSGIKMSELMKTIKQQERKIEAEQYRNEFFGKFLYRFIGEVRERVFVIGGLIDSITVEEQGVSLEEKKQYSQNIKKAIAKLMKIVESLEIEKISMLTVSTLEDILNSLFAIQLETNNAKLNFNYDNNYMSFQCDPKTLIYILADIIEYLLKVNIKEINFECKELNNNTTIKIHNKEIDNAVLEKIEKLSDLENSIYIGKDDEYITINIIKKEE